MDRYRPADEAFARLRPHFAALGISRVARQTGLDVVGIPCFAAFRPNARVLSTYQGKGLSDAAARASAAMEAAEVAVAEAPSCVTTTNSRTRLAATGAEIIDCVRLMPAAARINPASELRWVRGRRWTTSEPVWLPLAAVSFVEPEMQLVGLTQNTNGLASGGRLLEAEVHGVCELIERDATAIWSMLSLEAKTRTEIEPASLRDLRVDALATRMAKAGLRLRLFDQTTNIGVPSIMAILAEVGHARRRFSLAAGYACHPSTAQAAIGAITEAAQTRVTNIAGSRDDYLPTEYEQNVPEAWTAFIGGPYQSARQAPRGVDGRPSWEDLAIYLKSALAAAGVTDLAIVELGGAEYGISVIRAYSGALEDRDANPNWRPGSRAVLAMLGR